EPAAVQPQTRVERSVLAVAASGVRVERGGIAGEVRLQDVEPAVPVEISHADTHAGLRLAVLAVGAPGADADVLERPIVLVTIERARVGVVGDVNVAPPVVVEVERRDAEPKGAVRL